MRARHLIGAFSAAACCFLSLFGLNASALYEELPIEDCIEYVNSLEASSGSDILLSEYDLKMIDRVLEYDMTKGENGGGRVSALTMNKKEIKLNVDEPTDILTVKLYPRNALGGRVTWRSSDPDIATVDSSGKVTSVNNGAAVITAQAESGVYAMCKVVVQKQYPTGISFGMDELSVEVGTSIDVSAVLAPLDVVHCGITFSSDNPDVVEVPEGRAVLSDDIVTEICPVYLDGYGTINTAVNRTQTRSNLTLYAKSVGNAVITAVSENGKTAYLTVISKPIDTGIEITEEEIGLAVGETKQLNAKVLPENAVDRSVVWSSSDTSVAVVNEDGYVTGMKEGTAVITAESAHGYKDSCIVNVSPGPSSVQLSLSKMAIVAGESKQLFATVYPINASDRSVKWRTSDGAVATVDANGNVRGVGPGTAIITAITCNGYTARCSVTVNPLISAENVILSINDDNGVLELDKTYKLLWRVLPENTNQTITFTPVNDRIAVSPSGTVTPLSAGATGVIASTDSGVSVRLDLKVAAKDTSAYIAAPDTMYMKVGEIKLLPCTAYPNSGTISYFTTDSNIIIGEDGTVTAVSEGRATVYVSSNEASAKMNVEVCPANSYSASYVMMPDETYFKAVGDIFNVELLTDHNNPMVGQNWISSNPKVCSVSSKGEVRCTGVGLATVTCSSDNYSASCTVYVGIEAKSYESVVVNITTPEDVYLNVGETFAFDFDITPETERENISVTSQNPGIASVKNGVIYAKAEGFTLIRLTHKNGSTVWFKVNVTVPPAEDDEDESYSPLYSEITV